MKTAIEVTLRTSTNNEILICKDIINFPGGLGLYPKNLEDIDKFEKLGYYVMRTNTVIQSVFIENKKMDLMVGKRTIFIND
jgi:hypothetical protein